ncbi:alkanesulfonate monooxygenase [Williamsia limnetica]|uniref:Alkanesulfonate monooxygenase n=1 Tax=Williamsia limnetica TaxID=882452 RepID=A0A318RQG7_WILLI|nr:LLM class F420-dependent oxidoreductase [Williamsia limnetica]PYE18676.1 alkanesulfonate monooxygenase [Williamsia limnetica]
MELRIFVEPQQGATYSDQLAVARTAEAAGFGAFFRSDHYLAMNVEGSPGPTDSWVTLAGLARETSTIRLGTLVTSATFRHPGPLAIAVAQVDEVSGGRVDFGYGAGWFSAEHEAYAIPFPSLGERFDKLEESLAVITGLWKTPAGQTFSYTGDHYTVKDSPALPKPAQTPTPPIVLGGQGKKRTPALAAQYADEFNVPFISAEQAQQAFERVRQACEAQGRDAGDMVYSAALTVCAGTDDAEVARRAANIGRDLTDLRKDGLAGSPAEIVDKIGSYREIGASRIYLQVLDMSDLGHLEFIADSVMSQL